MERGMRKKTGRGPSLIGGLLLSVMVVVGCASHQMPGTQSPSVKRLRVLTYNIRHGEGSDGRVDLERAARVIREARADVVAVQEVDCRTSRVNGVDQAEELARLTGLRVAFGRAIDFAGGQYGNAILTRLESPRPPRTLPLPGEEKRSLLWMDLRTPPGTDGKAVEFAFLATHLDLSARHREASVHAIEKQFDENPNTPALLAGDLNADFGETAFRDLLRRWGNSVLDPTRAEPSCPADRPQQRIDHVLFRPQNRWRVIECRVLPEADVSDHRPVLAVLELLPKE